MVNRDRIYSLEQGEILEKNSHIEVLNAELDSFKVDYLYFIDVNHEEWVLTNGNQTIFRWANLHNRLVRTPIKFKTFNGNIELNIKACFLSDLLNDLHEVRKSIV